MPVDRRAAIQLGLLIAAVPVQFLVSRFMSTPEPQRQLAIQSLVNTAVNFKESYFSWTSWQTWCRQLITRMQQRRGVQDDDRGESPAIEVMRFKDPDGYFAGSPETRSPKPPHVKFRIGQVIRHKRWGYRGVIVGWDLTARAPEEWLLLNHPPDKPHWREQPNYSILVDTRDRISPQVTYVPQEHIEILSNVKVIHPSLDSYFEKFDGAQYIPRPALKVIYPHD